jgi:hypothetical protein
MEKPAAPSERPRRIEPEKLDLSDRDPNEPITIEEFEIFRKETNYKLALLLNRLLQIIDDPRSAREDMTWKEKIELATDIGYQNFTDFIAWKHAQERAQDPPSKMRPDQGAW